MEVARQCTETELTLGGQKRRVQRPGSREGVLKLIVFPAHPQLMVVCADKKRAGKPRLAKDLFSQVNSAASRPTAEGNLHPHPPLFRERKRGLRPRCIPHE